MTPAKRHIVTGTFNSPSLYVLEFDPLSSTPTTPATPATPAAPAASATLAILHEVEAEGPHQYLALGVSSPSYPKLPSREGGWQGLRKTVYATTWAETSTLSAWHVDPSTYGLRFGNRREITATGSYVHVQPPPYFSATGPGFGATPGIARWLGSAGGPTGELHTLDPRTGEIGEKVKELVFLPGGERELEAADKTRKALRYGAHSFDCSAAEEGDEGGKVAFVADLGSNSVKAYTFPGLELVYEVKSKREGDGPRHSIPHPHWPVLFTVTEHTNYVDAYQIPQLPWSLQQGKTARVCRRRKVGGWR